MKNLFAEFCVDFVCVRKLGYVLRSTGLARIRLALLQANAPIIMDQYEIEEEMSVDSNSTTEVFEPYSERKLFSN